MIKTKLIISLVAVFILAVAVWYSPVIFKGHVSTTTASHALVRAKNLALYDKYSTENELNIILSPERIPEEGVESFYGNRLGTVTYSYIIKIFDLDNNNKVVFANCIILALALIFFALAVYYLFGFKVFWFFSLIYIFLPSNWGLAQMMVGYEFPLLFLSLFGLLFTLGTKGFTLDQKRGWTQRFSLILSGVFVVLSCLAREAFFLLLPILFVFLFFAKSFRKIIYYIFIPVIIIWTIFWLPDFLKAKNTYLLFFNDQVSEELKSADFSYYAHLFPDPYTYHYDRDNYLRQEYNLEGLDAMGKLGREKVLTNMGFGPVGLWGRVSLGTTLFARHMFRFFSITEIGGPFIFLLFFLGLLVLKRQKKYWFVFYSSWILGSMFLLAYANLAGRNHLMDFGWPIALMSALGLVYLGDLLSQNQPGKNKLIIKILLLGLVIYSLILTGHIMWGQVYDNSSVLKTSGYINKIKTININSGDTVATPLSPNDVYNINFNTDQSLVVFNARTIEKLLAEERLTQAFDKFGVKYILGYSPELTQLIVENTEAVAVADSSLPIDLGSLRMNNKNWFLNLIK